MIIKILIIIAILCLLIVGLFGQGHWSIKALAILYAIANTIIFRELIFK